MADFTSPPYPTDTAAELRAAGRGAELESKDLIQYPTWRELHNHFEATDNEVEYDRLDAIEQELLKAGTNKPLTRYTDSRAWERYWQAIADTYVARHGDPTPRRDPK